MRNVFLARIGAIAIVLGGQVAHATELPGTRDSVQRCQALGQADFSRIPDALTQVMEAAVTGQTDESASYCQVTGYVAPSVGFAMRLPVSKWNGKFIELGCDGWCGNTDHIWRCDEPLRRGYACIVSDGGHKGTDAKWAYNNLEAEIDLAHRASHVIALAAKAIVAIYYGRAPERSYFMGCSRGGLQALQQAQKFPSDFDGIIAGAPSPRFAGQWMDRLWKKRAITDAAGVPVLAREDLELLHRAVLEKCDLNDGIQDSLIGDPRACDFDPSPLRCAADKDGGCLTAEQLERIGRIYGGPVTSAGEQIALSAALPAAERNWLDWFWGAGTSDRLLGDGFRYALFWPDPGPSWKLSDFDFDRDRTRMGVMAGLWEPSPDLRGFKAAGGKLLAYMGWSDVGAGGPLPIVDYYETAERIVGGRKPTQEFFRLFMIPGMNHCTGGEGAFAVDYLSYLEAWVERGQAPDQLLSSHVRLGAPEHAWRLRFPLEPASIEFSRPVYPYPTRAKYRGRGDPMDEASFEPVDP